MRSSDIDEMRRLPLFDQVATSAVDAMLRGAFLQRFPAQVELVREGEQADFLHVVIDGWVEMYAAYRDRETTLGVLGAGESFILAAALLDQPYLQSARALLPSRILMIPTVAVRRAFSEDAVFARRLAEDLAQAYRSIVRELKNQKLRSGLERLANWLLTQNAVTGSSGRFDFPFDKKVLASRIGMAPAVLSRAFASLEAYRVEVNGPSVVINDLEALRKLAQPSRTIDETHD
jgi:CRP/FNR family transcriptional activator FtrB